jgi:hypothetical protein
MLRIRISLLQFHMLRLKQLKRDLSISSKVLGLRNLGESLEDPLSVWDVLSGMCCIYPVRSYTSTNAPDGEL